MRQLLASLTFSEQLQEYRAYQMYKTFNAGHKGLLKF